MNKKTMESRKELMFDQLEDVTGGIMNPTDYEKIKARIEKSNMDPDKKKKALTKLYYFTRVPNFMDAKSVITYLQYRYGNVVDLLN